jgi:beta-galactosidase
VIACESASDAIRSSPMSKPLCSIVPKLPPDVLYGGDYNPEQWPEEVWLEDARLMQEAGVNLVSIAIFSWAKLEPKPGEYHFGWLDRVMDVLWGHGVSSCLATATASPPAWLVRAHPEMLPVDENGLIYGQGSRQHYCPNSRAYRGAAAALSRALAARYSQHPAVALWHINNEIGCHIHACYCDVCAADFRAWLKKRYAGLKELNESWGTAFWSQHYGDWEEILPPRKMPTFRNPGHALDYQRFMSESLMGVLLNEVEAVRSVDPAAKVTTNAVTLNKPTNYWEYYRHVDVAAWDAYPDPAAGLDEVCSIAFSHDLFRGMRGGLPFILMEQVTSQVNWRPNNVLKAPGQMRALSYQAVSRGADGVMFFQWRASRAGAEKFHGAMIPHAGPDTRVFREVKQLGGELKKLRSLLGASTRAKVAIIYSWENRWALEMESKPRAFDYNSLVVSLYKPLWAANIAVDVVEPHSDLSAYDVVLAPALYQLRAADAERLKSFVDRGGTLVVSFFSGIVDEREHIWLGGYPAPLRDVLGVTVEEWQPLAPGEQQSIESGSPAGSYSCSYFSEKVHPKGAQVLARYSQGIFNAAPAVTLNKYGRGEAIYVSTLPDGSYLAALYQRVLQAKRIGAPIAAPAGVEATVRTTGQAEYLFILNQTSAAAEVDLRDWSGTDVLSGKRLQGKLQLEPFGVRIVSRTTA